MKQTLRANLLLLLTATIWGAAFVAQVVAADSVAPLAFNASRMLLAALALCPVICWMDRRSLRRPEQGQTLPFSRMSHEQRRSLLTGSLLCGLMLTLGSSFQQLGIDAGASAGKAGFITAMYIVLVPLLGLFRKQRVTPLIFLAVCISLIGLYLLCITEQLTIEMSDLYLMLCALCFSLHILAVDHFSRRTDCVKLSCLQFLVVAMLCGVASALTETVVWSDLVACAVPILYAGVLSGAVGYTLQIVAQKDTNPTVASLIMCLESVFAAIFGWLILGDLLTVRETLGCCAMFCAIVLAQLPVGPTKGMDA